MSPNLMTWGCSVICKNKLLPPGPTPLGTPGSRLSPLVSGEEAELGGTRGLSCLPHRVPLSLCQRDTVAVCPFGWSGRVASFQRHLCDCLTSFPRRFPTSRPWQLLQVWSRGETSIVLAPFYR